MRRGRFLAPGAVEGVRAGIYHCVSRVVDRRGVLERVEKEQFVRLMRLYAEFCGVRVLAFCVMTNHFHLLVEVPPRPEEDLPEHEFFRRLSLLYPEGKVEEVREWIRQRRQAGDLEGVREIREKFLYRMWDLSQFMKTLKQRFTQWFNKRHGRRGTLWEDRFRSVIVEDGYAARVVAAYIDLNPVRAGLVSRPEDYRWCGYAAAMAGEGRARDGIARVMSHFEEWRGGRRDAKRWREVIGRYREILYTDGVERGRPEQGSGEGRVGRRGVSRQEAEKVRAAGGTLSPGQMLRLRIRHFVDGAAIGRQEFVEAVFQQERERFGPRRQSGPRKIRGCETVLRSLRDLRDGVG